MIRLILASIILSSCQGDNPTISETPKYEISTAAELSAIRNDLSGTYILTNDITLPATSGVDPNCVSATSDATKLGIADYCTKGWLPIGDENNPFNGKVDGAGFDINGLFIDRTENYYKDIGLFSFTTRLAYISNIGINIVGFVRGYWDVGGLVGLNAGMIANSYVNGQIIGDRSVGGLVGTNYGGIVNSFSTADIFANSGRVGGLVGDHDGASIGVISDSYATGDVVGGGQVGGFVGVNSNDGAIENSYSAGNVSSSGNLVGGFLGQNNNGGAVKNSFATGNVSGIQSVGGFSGDENITLINSYRSVEATITVEDNTLGTPLPSSMMQTTNFIFGTTGTNDVGWSQDIWDMVDGGYPLLKWQNSAD